MSSRFLNSGRTGKFAMRYDGRLITDFVFDFFQFIDDNRAVARINGYYGILDTWGTLYASAGISRIVYPEPVFWENGWVWRVEPTLPYGRIVHCLCSLFFDESIWSGASIDPQTGLISNVYHNGHGGGSSGWVYDPVLGLFGNPVRSFAYGTHIGMHPLGNFESSVVDMYLEIFGEGHNFEDWLLQDLRRSLLSRSVIVQTVDSTKRTIWEFPWYDEYSLTSEAFLGRFALMRNMEFITDFIFDDMNSGWSFFGASINGLWGIIDHDSNVLMDFQFEHILPICGDTAFVKYNGYYGILDITRTLWSVLRLTTDRLGLQ